MKIIIVRHGETLGNISGIYQGNSPGKLSEPGKNQAKKLALRLKDEKIDHIFSSDLTRAIEILDEIKTHHSNIPFTLTKELREVNFGSWEGKTKQELGFKESYKPPLPKDAETKEELYNRAKAFLEEINQKYEDKTILLVTHNATIKALIAVLNGKSYENIKNMETQHNTGVNIFESSTDGNYKNTLYNCKAHLD